MSRFDIACKSFFSKPKNFAEIINGTIFDGRMVINPNDLQEFETELLFEEQGKSYFVDIAKKWTINGYSLLIIAIENQKYIDYSMVVRNMFNEALAYKNQVDNIKQYHNKANDVKDDEYISKYSKKDMLTPIITVVIYFGDKPWDGPKSLYDMIDMEESLKSFIYNYKLNLIDYHDHKCIDTFHDECRLVFDALLAKQDKTLFENYMKKNRNIHLQTANLVCQILNIDINKKNIIHTMEGDEVDMCKALDDIKNDYKNEGISIGEQRGITIGEQRGITIGEQRGITIGEQRGEAKERENNASNMIKLKLSVNTIMSCINISLDELKSLSDKIGVALTY